MSNLDKRLSDLERTRAALSDRRWRDDERPASWCEWSNPQPWPAS